MTPENVTNGYRFVAETLGCAIVPPGAFAVTNNLWLKRGAYESAFSIPATNWSFRVPDGEASNMVIRCSPERCGAKRLIDGARERTLFPSTDPESRPHVTFQSPNTVFVEREDFRRLGVLRR